MKNAIWLFVSASFLLFIFLPSYTKMQDLRQRSAHYDRQIEILKKQRTALLDEKKLLESDPLYLEKVAREKMGLVKEGEIVYQLPTNRD